MNPRAEHFGAEEVDLRKIVFTRELLACVPADIARRHRVVPVQGSRRQVRIAIADPSDFDALESVQTAVQREVEVVVADERQIAEFIPRLYPEGSA